MTAECFCHPTVLGHDNSKARAAYARAKENEQNRANLSVLEQARAVQRGEVVRRRFRPAEQARAAILVK